MSSSGYRLRAQSLVTRMFLTGLASTAVHVSPGIGAFEISAPESPENLNPIPSSLTTQVDFQRTAGWIGELWDVL